MLHLIQDTFADKPRLAPISYIGAFCFVEKVSKHPHIGTELNPFRQTTGTGDDVKDHNDATSDTPPDRFVLAKLCSAETNKMQIFVC